MATKDQIIQRFARIYREEYGVDEIDTNAFADYLISKGLKPPPMPTARELMAKAAKRALKHEVRHDELTGHPYHGWHAVPKNRDAQTGQLMFSYVDIDDAPRDPMLKALTLRVSMMVDDGVQVTFDAEHWTRVNPDKAPISVEELLDLREQVQWRIQGQEDEPHDP